MSLTRAELRRRVADTLGELTVLDATALGTTTTIVDTINAYQPDDHFKGRTIYFTNGTNLGLTRTVTGSTQATGTITFTPAATAAPAAGDDAELYNERAQGWGPAEIHRALNQALDAAYPLALTPQDDDSASPFDVDTGTISLPSGLLFLSKVEYQGPDSLYHPIPRARRSGGYGYFVNVPSANITIGGGIAHDADGNTIRFHGFGRQALFTADTDTTEIDPEWLVAKACASLLFAGIARDPDRERLFLFYERKAEALRYRLMTALPPNTERARVG